MPRPLILIHGYSDNTDSFKRWIDELKAIYKDDQSFSVHLCDYRTLTNEISLKDIAEGFDRALRRHQKLSKETEFDVIVHSTGMLVIRAWLTLFDSQRRYGRLKHLVALAPATFGSPLAKKGRSWLGAIFKGKRHWGPDFMEAGDLVLDALELGSSYVWELAHKDLLCPQPVYGSDSDTPYVFSFCGTQSYGFIADLVTDETGSDGTVRWAGCALNTRKIMIDLSVDEKERKRERVVATPWSNIEIPFIPVVGCHHGSILTDPPDNLIRLVANALQVADKQAYDSWCEQAVRETENALAGQAWQQFIVRVVDERGDPIPDYYIQLYTEAEGERTKFREFAMDVDTYSKDHSYRCFHVNLSELKKSRLKASGEDWFTNISNLWIRIMATTGTRLIGYTGYGAENLSFLEGEPVPVNRPGDWDAKIAIPTAIKVKSKKQGRADEEISFFHPFTTTLVEIKLNREPFPFGLDEINNVATIDHHLENRD